MSSGRVDVAPPPKSGRAQRLRQNRIVNNRAKDDRVDGDGGRFKVGAIADCRTSEGHALALEVYRRYTTLGLGQIHTSHRCKSILAFFWYARAAAR
jgi:hypothetical protein